MAANTMPSWRFAVKVREGAPGFADDDEFVSRRFSSFAQCHEAYYAFNPDHRWPHLRSVYSRRFIFDGPDGEKETSITHRNVVHYTDEQRRDMGVTDQEVAAIAAAESRRSSSEQTCCRFVVISGDSSSSDECADE